MLHSCVLPIKISKSRYVLIRHIRTTCVDNLSVNIVCKRDHFRLVFKYEENPPSIKHLLTRYYFR